MMQPAPTSQDTVCRGGELACPLCGSERSRFLYASPAGEDHYARAAGLPPENPITSYFCLSCGVIFNTPCFLGQPVKNVYEKTFATHPHGLINFQGVFNVPWKSILKRTVLKALARAVRDHLRDSQRGGLLAGIGVFRHILKGGSLPLNLRLERDFAILQSLLRQGGDPPFQPRDVLTVGCPLMAFMPLALGEPFNSRLSCFKAFYENYWGKACRINGADCLRCSDTFSGAIQVERWEELGRYDFIYVAEALDHVYDISGFMRRLQRHLKPGGFLCIENHFFFEHKTWFNRFPAQHSVIFTERSWRNLLRLVGYEQVGIYFGQADFYALLRVAETSGRAEEPPIEEYEALLERVQAKARNKT